jgi:hypothetical protein
MPETPSFPLADPSLEVREKVSNWLRSDGWMVQETPSPDLAWMLVARKDGPPLLVGQSSESLDCVLLRYQIDFSQDHRNRLSALSKADRTQFVWDLVTQINHTGVEFVLDDPVPKSVLLTVVIYYDGLTKDRFMQRLIRLNSATRAIFMVLSRAFGTLLQPVTFPKSH